MEKSHDAAHRIMMLHGRIAYLAGLALNLHGADKIAIELADIRNELSEIFDLLRPELGGSDAT